MKKLVVLSVLLVMGTACEEDRSEVQAGDVLAEAPDLGGLAQASPQLWFTCGDPVCSGWTNKGLKKCGNRSEGDPCTAQQIGLECDPHDACNATLVCSDTNPIGPVGCPISRRSAKKDVDYVDPARLQQLHDELMGVRLATYRYNDEALASPTHLGFIIDDMPTSPAIAPNGQQVDLYAYASMAVAALQVQQRQIEALTHEVALLRAQQKQGP
jgi:hypothetical protein